MKTSIYIFLYLFLLLTGAEVYGQVQPCTQQTSTFDLSVATAGNGIQYVISDAMEYTPGEFAVVGIRFSAGNRDLYFAKMNAQGDFIGTPQFLVHLSGLPVFNDELKPAYLEKTTDPAGSTTGFIIASTVQANGSNNIWVGRLNLNGCMEWGRFITPFLAGQEYTVKGLVRAGQNDYAVIAHEFNAGLPPGASNSLSVHKFTSVGPPCISYTYTDSQIPVAIAPVDLMLLPGADYVVLGRFPGAENYQLTFLDANFQEVNPMPNFDPDINNQQEVLPADVIQLGEDLYITGRYEDISGLGWLQKVNLTPNGWLSLWSKYIDFPDDPVYMQQADHPRELAVRAGEISLAGFTDLGTSNNRYIPWMLQFDEMGGYTWGERYDKVSKPFGRFHTLITANSGGYFAAGTNYSNPTGGIQNYFVHCDELGQVGDCLCHSEGFFTITSPVGEFSFDTGLEALQTDCIFPFEGSDCKDETTQQDSCYKDSGMPACEVNIVVTGYDSCTGTVFFDAIPLNYTGTVTYSWDFGDGNLGFGQSVSNSFSGPGPFNVCVTASDATCTDLACISVTPLLDNTAPIALCVPGALVSLNAFGLGSLPTTVIDAGSVDDCGPVTLSLSPNQFDCSDLFTPVNVTLTVTDQSGNTSTCTASVGVVDPLDPILNCPSDMTVDTDPGECFAALDMSSTASDNCPPPTVMHVLSGALGSTNPINNFPTGITNITATATDGSGNSTTCSYSVTVIDNEDPVATCPTNQSATVPICDGGAVVSFPPPQFTDNCGIAVDSCTNYSGDFFPCGNTTVTCFVTDVNGNTSSCSFVVSVDCECGILVSSDISCTSDPAVFDFEVVLEDVSGAVTCSPLLTSLTSSMNLNVATIIPSGPNEYTFNGTLTATTNPPPTTINLLGEFNCVCGDGTTINCQIPVQLTTPCCDSVFVEDREVCVTQDTAQIQLLECMNVANVTQVRWYVAPAPCPPGAWGPPYQVSPGCEPLVLLPNYMDGDVCVYAEVSIGGNGPCTMLTSNMATVHLCQPITCSLPSFDECYTGTPVPMPNLTVSITNPDNCDYTLEWLDPSGNVLQTGGLSYTPSMSFDFIDPPANCYQDHNYYRVRVEGPCGPQECVSTLRLYHDSAPKGTISMTHPANQPICPGYFAELLFEPDCSEYVGDPPKWEWCHGPDQSSFVPLPGAGDKNPIWWTNRLYQDTWYQVKTQNGPCPVDTVNFLVDVRDQFEILSFNANFAPFCDPMFVAMNVSFAPSGEPGCNVTIKWYRDGTLIGTTTNATSPASFSYPGPDLEGNYYAVLERSCCEEVLTTNLVEIPAVWKPKILGPCFICNNDPVVLEGVILDGNSSLNCTYSWFDLGGTPLGSGTSITVTLPGSYILEVTCNGCTKRDTFFLPQCLTSSCPIVNVYNASASNLNLKVQPNPANDWIIVNWGKFLSDETKLSIYNINGVPVITEIVGRGNTSQELNIGELPAGIYFIVIQSEGYQLGRTRIIKS